MAQLRDTLIQGSARVTDTLYTNNININDILSTKKLVISSTTAEEHIQFSRTDNINYILFPNNANTGIGIGYSVAVNSCPLIINKTSVYPGITATLGTSGNRWNGVYSSTGDFSGTVTADRLSTNIFLDFRRTDGPSYIMMPDGKDLIINNGSSNGTAYADLQIGKTGITNAYAGSLGSSTYPWGSLYSKGPSYIYSGNSQWCLDTYIYNKSKNQVAEIYYNSGNADNVTTGQFSFRQYSPKATPDTAPSGFHETFQLPSVTAARTDNGIYSIITTKNLSIITTVGTISSGTWNGSKIGVAYGGTGATTFTSDCVVVGNGTNAMESRGLKVTGATNADVVVQAYTSGKGLTIQSPGGEGKITITSAANSGTGTISINSASTIWINKPNNSSVVFTSGGAETISNEKVRINTSGMLQLNTGVTQNTHKLLVNGDSAFTGKIAFIDTPAATLTEKVYIQQANNTIQLVAKAINFPTITDGTGIVASDLGASANPRYRPASWKYNAGITPVDGDIVTIKIPSAAHDYGTWLSLDNGSTYHPIIHSNGSRLQNWFSNNMSITLRYDSAASCSVFGVASNGSLAASNGRTPVVGCWRLITQYDTGNPGDWNLRQYILRAATAITAGHIIGGTDSGYNHVDNGVAFDIRYAVLYAASDIAASGTGSNNFIHHYAINIKNSSGNAITLTTYKNVYIKGTISGNLFTPISGGNPFVADITEADDGYVYYYIGRCYSSGNAFTFDATGRSIYWYKNGIICEYNGLNNVSNNSSLNNISGAVGDIIYWSAANTPAHLTKGAAGKFLKMGNNNVPIWGDGSEVTLNGTATTTPSFYAPSDSGTVNYLLKSGGPNTAPIWDTHASIDSAGMLHILSVKAHDGFWVNDTYFKGDGTQHIKEALICVDADNMNQGEVLYEYNASTSTSRFGLYTYANIYNDTSVNTYLTLGISTDGTVKRTYTDAQIYGAVWNDYAEYRKQLYEIEPGRVVRDLNSGHVVLTEERLIPGAQVVSDTFGFAIGETKECKTPLAVSGRVLVFTTQDRYKYNAGDAVCSGPHGTVDIMTREEIQKYPDAIVGIVSEIPTYDTWGQNEVPVQGRIWIKVR